MAHDAPRLLMLIADEPARCRRLTALAARDGWRVIVAPDRQSAFAALAAREGRAPSAIAIDQLLPGDDACALIGELRRRRPALPILMLATGAAPQMAVEAMRAGATDYLIEPVAPDRLLRALRSATAPGTPGDELYPLTEKLGVNLDFDAMIGAAPDFRAALAAAAMAARAHTPVLIEGERGTGKEMLVRAMHAASPRARAPLRFVDLAAIPPNHVESALFGHERGAFPGAFDRQAGALQAADGATLVLDEIDCLPAPVQERLATFLAEGLVRPIGARHGFRFDVRLIAASNAALDRRVAEGTFRKDLFRALTAGRVALPPLRRRRGDLPALARHFLARAGEQPGLRPLGITAEALALLAAYDWPGNVRQLQAVLFRAAVFCDGDALTADHFPNLARSVGGNAAAATQVPEGGGVVLYAADGNLRSLEEIEADIIRLAIGHYRGRMTEVARRLGIGRSTLYRRLVDLGIDKAA